MITTSSPSITNEDPSSIVARIDTTDESFILPIREYLETQGCRVFVNSGPTSNVTYYFIVGDNDFVKRTLAFRHDFGEKQLIVSWDTENHESVMEYLGRNAKVVFINPTLPTKKTIEMLFTFLFTGKTKNLNIQEKQGEVKIKTDDIKIRQIETLTKKAVEETVGKKQETKEVEEKNRVSHLIDDIFEIAPPKKNQQIKNPSPLFLKIRTIFLSLFLFLLLCLSPFFIYGGSIGLRIWMIQTATACFRDGKGACVEKNLTNQKLIQTSQIFITPLVHGTLKTLGYDKEVKSYENINFLLDSISEMQQELLTINNAIVQMTSSIFFNQEKENDIAPIVAVDLIKKTMPAIRAKLDLSYIIVSNLKNETAFPFNNKTTKNLLAKIEQKIATYRRIAETGERIALLYPLIGGFREKQNIIVALQNNSELRPTGGFIGSLMRLSLSDGIIDDMRIEDVYTLDGQLKGHVDPPLPLKTILNQEHWYLRDSNWEPDFPKSAATMRWFYEKESKESIDSVIGITASLIIKLLKITGPIDITTYNDRITAENFYGKSVYYTHNNFFPGSTQKKDFLGALMEGIIMALQKNKHAGSLTILEILSDALVSKDIQWYSINPDVETAVLGFGWGGNTPAQTTCTLASDKLPCSFSFLHINEANLAVNKVNAFIERNQSKTIAIDEDGSLSHSITRKIRNLSSVEAGAGEYITYMRFVLPRDIALTTLTLDGKSIPLYDPKAKNQTLPYHIVESPSEKTITLGVSFSVPSGKERVINLSFGDNKKLLFGENGTLLTLYEQKQAGVDTVPTTTIIRYPESWKGSFFTPEGDNAVANTGQLEYNTLLSEDNEHTIRFLR